MDFSGPVFNALVLVFVATTMLAVGLGATGPTLRKVASNARFLAGAVVANLLLIPAFGWVIAEALVAEAPVAAPLFIALVLAAASPGGPFGAKLAQLQRGDEVAGAALMSILAVLGSVTVPITVALILSLARVGGVDDISVGVGPLIARIVLAQIVPFLVGFAVRATSAPVAERARPPVRLLSNLAFLVVLGWVLIGGFEDLVSMPGSFLLAATLLIAAAILLGVAASPGPRELRTTAGAVAGVRNAAPILAVFTAEFPHQPRILPAVVTIVVVELLLQVPWNLWLARRRAGRELRAGVPRT